MNLVRTATLEVLKIKARYSWDMWENIYNDLADLAKRLKALRRRCRTREGQYLVGLIYEDVVKERDAAQLAMTQPDPRREKVPVPQKQK